MNEQIRKLAIKAGIDVRGHLTGNLILDEKPSVNDLEKFAELIVQDCANELLKWRYEPFPLDAESAARIIKQHFGVK